MASADPSNFFRTEADLARDQARKEKAILTKDEGSPLQLRGKPLHIQVLGDDLWVAESGSIVSKYSLQTSKLLQTYRGHTGPVTCVSISPTSQLLFSGSWDKTIKVWDTSRASLLSSVEGHSDFLKCLLIIPSLTLLVSGGSDKVIRFWNFSGGPLKQLDLVGSCCGHTRPVECFSLMNTPSSEPFVTLFSADSMGVINVWRVEQDPESGIRPQILAQLEGHRTGINDMWFGDGCLWTASTDCTAVIQSFPKLETVAFHTVFEARHAVKALLPLSLTFLEETILIAGVGDSLQSYDISSKEDSVMLGEIDSHCHNITGIQLWNRHVSNMKDPDGAGALVISASLDGTIRRWTLEDIKSPKFIAKRLLLDSARSKSNITFTDQELDDLLQDD